MLDLPVQGDVHTALNRGLQRLRGWLPRCALKLVEDSDQPPAPIRPAPDGSASPYSCTCANEVLVRGKRLPQVHSEEPTVVQLGLCGLRALPVHNLSELGHLSVVTAVSKPLVRCLAVVLHLVVRDQPGRMPDQPWQQLVLHVHGDVAHLLHSAPESSNLSFTLAVAPLDAARTPARPFGCMQQHDLRIRPSLDFVRQLGDGVLLVVQQEDPLASCVLDALMHHCKCILITALGCVRVVARTAAAVQAVQHRVSSFRLR